MARAGSGTYDTLREAILSGRYVPGERLAEVDLATTLGVSRTPVREALRTLAADGLVEVLPNRGARVSSWSAEDLDEMYGLRALLEAHGAERAATRATPDDIRTLDELATGMDDVASPGSGQDLDRLAKLNGAFHERIITVADSPRLHAMLQTVVQIPLVLRTFRRYGDAALRRSLRHHHELVAAFDAREPEWAASVMRSHVLAARSVLLTAAHQDIATPDAGTSRPVASGRRPSSTSSQDPATPEEA